jgi:spore coat protein A, manganese oxidase
MMAIGGAAATLRVPGQSLAGFAAEGVRPFRVPLRIPPVLKPSRGNDFYETTMRKAYAHILPDKKTRIWGFEGEFPGPTIKVRRGREVVVRRHNRLDVPATIHLHGGKVRPSSDGQPMDLIAPGSLKDYVYPNAQDAATLWYHDHTHHRTSRNNYMGLSGLYIIEDPDEADLNLPKGKYDIPLVLQERSFRSDGSFKFYMHHNKVPGDTTLVNGRPMPYLKVANRRYRFRILNASHTTGYNLQLESGDPLVQIATDGGLTAQPTPVPSLQLWPAERAEVVVDFSRHPVGTKVVLSTLKDPLDPASARPVMRFEVAREENDDSSLPVLLRPMERLVPGTVEREFALSFDFDRRIWVINGKAFDHSRIDARPKLGDTEVWTFRNNSTKTHPMHIHLVRFQVLDRSNGKLDSNDLGWKDTVRVDPASTVRVAVKFEGFTGRYMFHCHNLAHEDMSMMGQMKVVRA